MFASLCWGQNDEASFRFTPPDEKLLAQANELDAQFEKKGLIFHDERVEHYLNSIGARLIGSTAAPEHVTYRFRIARDPLVNAFALPNGSIYINSGLVAAMQNEGELAAVMAHEITHVTNRHSYLQNRSIRKKAVALDAIGLVAGAAGYFPAGAAFGYSIVFAAQVSEVLIIASVYGYSRDLERDADTIGYGRLIHAEYDGAEMARSFELLDERLEFEPIEPFWRTHPKLEARIAAAKKLAIAENAPNPRPSNETDYLEQMAPVIRYNIALDLESRRSRTALARAQRLSAAAPNDNGAKVLLADAYRSLGAKTSRPDEAEKTGRGKETARNRIVKLTAEEEQRALIATPAGKAALESNRAAAEKLYRESIAADPSGADAHRGLGMLYQDEARYREAAGEYRRYLDLAAPAALDRLRIERRLEASLKFDSGSNQ